MVWKKEISVFSWFYPDCGWGFVNFIEWKGIRRWGKEPFGKWGIQFGRTL